MADIFPSYPPSLHPKALSLLIASLTDYCLSHGIIVRPTEPSSGNHLAAHAPVTLFPSLFPRKAWEQALKVQTMYNVLYARIANDEEWMGNIMNELAGVDDFVRDLWELYQDVQKEGIVQNLSLGLFRSDYMIHVDPSESPSVGLTIKQIEFNAIASSFGGLSSAVTKLHQYLLAIGAYGKDTLISKASLPNNPAAEKLAAGIALAHKAYGVPTAAVLFIVQDPERNAFDQRWIEYHLLKNHGIQTYRMTLKEVASEARLVDRKLIVPKFNTELEPQEISVVYLRAGYGPAEYPSKTEWNARRLLELSRAIKCPTIITQLAGCKKVQQVLAKPMELERFLGDDEAQELRKTFAKMYPLDTSEQGLVARKLAFSNPDAYVLKPQREGGGNNIYRSNIPKFLRSLPDESHYNAYILMELIQPPPLTNSIIRAGEVASGGVVGELGVYGTILWDSQGNVLGNEEAGWLLRTKGKGVDEGGVAAGFGCVDSTCLV